jgi:hypothetical protein
VDGQLATCTEYAIRYGEALIYGGTSYLPQLTLITSPHTASNFPNIKHPSQVCSTGQQCLEGL